MTNHARSGGAEHSGGRLVYLDSAVIDNIADGSMPHNEVEALLHVMRDRGDTLLLSIAHVLDFTHATDRATHERITATLRRFPHVVLLKPDHLERERENVLRFGAIDDWKRPPSELAARPLRVVPIDDASELLKGDVRLRASLQFIHAAERAMVWADQIGRDASKGPRVVPPKVTAGILDAFSNAESGESAWRRVEQLVAPYGSAQPKPLRIVARVATEIAWRASKRFKAFEEVAEARGARKERITRLLTQRSGFESVGFVGANIPGDDRARRERMAWLCPGIELARARAESLARNNNQVPTANDHQDREHLQHLPYVDVATVDAAVFDTYRRLRPMLRVEGRGVVLKNPGKTLRPIIDALRD